MRSGTETSSNASLPTRGGDHTRPKSRVDRAKLNSWGGFVLGSAASLFGLNSTQAYSQEAAQIPIEQTLDNSSQITAPISKLGSDDPLPSVIELSRLGAPAIPFLVAEAKANATTRPNISYHAIESLSLMGESTLQIQLELMREKGLEQAVALTLRTHGEEALRQFFLAVERKLIKWEPEPGSVLPFLGDRAAPLLTNIVCDESFPIAARVLAGHSLGNCSEAALEHEFSRILKSVQNNKQTLGVPFIQIVKKLGPKALEAAPLVVSLGNTIVFDGSLSECLVAIGSPALESIRKGFEVPGTKLECAVALATLDPNFDPLVPYFVELAKTTRSREHEIAAVEALGKIKTRPAFEALINLAMRHTGAQWRCFKQIEHYTDLRKDAVQHILSLAEERNVGGPIVERALDTLSPESDYPKPIIEFKNERASGKTPKELRALEPGLAEALTYFDGRVRHDSLVALQEIGISDTRTLQMVIGLLEDPLNKNCNRAFQVLKSLKGQFIDEFYRALKSEALSAKAKASICRLIDKLPVSNTVGEQSIVDAIVAHKDNEEFCDEAVKCISRLPLDPEKKARALASSLNSVGGVLAATELLKLGKQATPALPQLMACIEPYPKDSDLTSDWWTKRQIACLRCLVSIGEPVEGALSIIENICTDHLSEVSRHAFLAKVTILKELGKSTSDTPPTEAEINAGLASLSSTKLAWLLSDDKQRAEAWTILRNRKDEGAKAVLNHFARLPSDPPEKLLADISDVDEVTLGVLEKTLRNKGENERVRTIAAQLLARVRTDLPLEETALMCISQLTTVNENTNFTQSLLTFLEHRPKSGRVIQELVPLLEGPYYEKAFSILVKAGKDAVEPLLDSLGTVGFPHKVIWCLREIDPKLLDDPRAAKAIVTFKGERFDISDDMREEAAKALAQEGTPEAFKLIAEEFWKSYPRPRAAFRALRDMDQTKRAQALDALLEKRSSDENPPEDPFWNFAVRELDPDRTYKFPQAVLQFRQLKKDGELTTKDAEGLIPQIVEAQTHIDRRVREESLIALIELAQHHETALNELLNHVCSPIGRKHYMQVVHSLSQHGGQWVPLLLDKVKGRQSREMVEISTQILKGLGPKLAPYTSQILNSIESDGTSRNELIEVLVSGNVSSLEVVQVLERELNREPSIFLIRALGKHQGFAERIAARLVEFIATDIPPNGIDKTNWCGYQDATIASLAELGPGAKNSRPALLRLLGVREDCSEVTKALGNILQIEPIVLENQLRDPRIGYAIKHFAADPISHSEFLLSEFFGGRLDNRGSNAAIALSCLGEEAIHILPRLCQGLKDANDRIRIIPILATIGDKALPSLQSFFDDTSNPHEARIAAAVSLIDINPHNPSVKDALQKCVFEVTDELALRQEAFRALIALELPSIERLQFLVRLLPHCYDEKYKDLQEYARKKFPVAELVSLASSSMDPDSRQHAIGEIKVLMRMFPGKSFVDSAYHALSIYPIPELDHHLAVDFMRLGIGGIESDRYQKLLLAISGSGRSASQVALEQALSNRAQWAGSTNKPERTWQSLARLNHVRGVWEALEFYDFSPEAQSLLTSDAALYLSQLINRLKTEPRATRIKLIPIYTQFIDKYRDWSNNSPESSSAAHPASQICLAIQSELISLNSPTALAAVMHLVDVRHSEISSISRAANYESLQKAPWLTVGGVTLPHAHVGFDLNKIPNPWNIEYGAPNSLLSVLPKTISVVPFDPAQFLTSRQTLANELAATALRSLGLSVNEEIKVPLALEQLKLVPDRHPTIVSIPFMDTPYDWSLAPVVIISRDYMTEILLKQGKSPEESKSLAEYAVNRELQRRAVAAYASLRVQRLLGQDRKIEISSVDQRLEELGVLAHDNPSLAQTEIIDSIASLPNELPRLFMEEGLVSAQVVERQVSLKDGKFREVLVGQTAQGRTQVFTWVGPVPSTYLLDLGRHSRILDFSGTVLSLREIDAALQVQDGILADIDFVRANPSRAISLIQWCNSSGTADAGHLNDAVTLAGLQFYPSDRTSLNALAGISPLGDPQLPASFPVHCGSGIVSASEFDTFVNVFKDFPASILTAQANKQTAEEVMQFVEATVPKTVTITVPDDQPSPDGRGVIIRNRKQEVMNPLYYGCKADTKKVIDESVATLQQRGEWDWGVLTQEEVVEVAPSRIIIRDDFSKLAVLYEATTVTGNKRLFGLVRDIPEIDDYLFVTLKQNVPPFGYFRVDLGGASQDSTEQVSRYVQNGIATNRGGWLLEKLWREGFSDWQLRTVLEQVQLPAGAALHREMESLKALVSECRTVTGKGKPNPEFLAAIRQQWTNAQNQLSGQIRAAVETSKGEIKKAQKPKGWGFYIGISNVGSPVTVKVTIKDVTVGIGTDFSSTFQFTFSWKGITLSSSWLDKIKDLSAPPKFDPEKIQFAEELQRRSLEPKPLVPQLSLSFFEPIAKPQPSGQPQSNSKLFDLVANRAKYFELQNNDWGSNEKVKAALKNSGTQLQTLDKGIAGVRHDYYSIVVKKMPPGLTAETFLREMAMDMNKAIKNPGFNLLSDFSRRNGTSGTLEVGDIYDIDILGPVPDSPVMLVHLTDSEFIFHTLTGHVECGLRSFGFKPLSDGTYMFYTRGVSTPRPLTPDLLGKIPRTLQTEMGSLLQTDAWVQLMLGIRDELNLRGGEVDLESPEVRQIDMP